MVAYTYMNNLMTQWNQALKVDEYYDAIRSMVSSDILDYRNSVEAMKNDTIGSGVEVDP